MPIFEEPRDTFKVGGRPDPWSKLILEAKDYPDKWIRITEEPKSVGTLYRVRRVMLMIENGLPEIVDKSRYDVEVRSTAHKVGHLYVRYNGEEDHELHYPGGY